MANLRLQVNNTHTNRLDSFVVSVNSVQLRLLIHGWFFLILNFTLLI